MTLSADEFLRRFLLHVLPDGFQRIRHYGLLGNRHRAENLARCRELLAVPIPIPQPEPDYRQRCRQLNGQDPLRCPQCKTGQMVRIAILVPVARPVQYGIAHESGWVGRGLVFRSPCQHGSRPVCLPLPSLPREPLSPPANSVFTPLLEAKTGWFAASSSASHAQNRLPWASNSTLVSFQNT